MAPSHPLYTSGLRIAEVLAARLCHDIAGPLGVVAGLMELAAEDGDEEALANARDAAARLARQLELRRAAWAGDPAPLSVAMLERLAMAASAERRIDLDIAGLAGQADFGAAAGQVVLNLLLLGIGALPGGGTLAMAGTTGREVLLRVAGPRAGWPAGMAACLADPDAAWERIGAPREMQMPLTVLLAARAGFRLSMLLPVAAAGDAPPPLLLQFA